jgi:butyryl-CoA:acetate CoA-transferase
MSPIDIYKKKLISPQSAAKLVHSGDWVDYSWGASAPQAFDQALAQRADELEDVQIRAAILLREPEIFKVDPTGEHFVLNTWYSGPHERTRVNQSGGFYNPLRYSELPRYYRENCDVDVAVITTTPMDRHGFFNFGISASHMNAVLEKAKTIIVEVNDQMPRCQGANETEIHVDNVDFVIESDNDPMPELGQATPSDLDEKVAGYVFEEVHDGACLQLGIGGMANAVGLKLAESDLKDLGVHTEMYVDAFVDLTEAGKITGARKNIDRYRQVYAFAAGTSRLYDFIDDNPELMSAPTTYTNDTRVIASIENMVSINNAIEVDLTGQVSSESNGFRHISGAGGQLDFMLGAYLSPGGKSIICLPSTYTDKKTGERRSRIVLNFAPGTAVSCTRANTHFVVTEWGKFNCKGQSTWQRAEGLINIAHPDFREDLIKQAEKAGIWLNHNRH